MSIFQKFFFLFIFFTLFISCAKKDEVTDAIEEANYFLTLSTPKCQKAIDLLEDVDADSDDVKYIQTLASAYACRAGFSELEFFDEVTNIESSGSSFYSSITLLPTSVETEADSDSFTDLQQSIDILLYAGGISSSSAEARIEALGNRHGNNINMQALYMILVQMGKFFHFYGNVDEDGTKGAGDASVDEQGATPSECFFEYTGVAQVIINGNPATGSCDTSGDPGHPDLSGSAQDLPVTIRRMCYGLVLMNNLMDLLLNTTLSDNDSLGDIGDIATDISAAMDTAAGLYPQLGPFLDELDQAGCEDYANTNSNFDYLQIYYAALFEPGLI